MAFTVGIKISAACRVCLTTNNRYVDSTEFITLHMYAITDPSSTIVEGNTI